MKTLFILSVLILLTFASCHNTTTENPQNQEIPRALTDDRSSFDIASKRGSGDLVESLYSELVDKTPELKQFENEMDNLTRSKADSTESFNKYTSKNQSYFNAAIGHNEQIKDSVLREKIKALIHQSSTRYDSSVVLHNGLLQSIEAKWITLNDLHTVLKIRRTLPVIEKFQKDHLPATTPLKAFSKQLEDAVKHAGTLSEE